MPALDLADAITAAEHPSAACSDGTIRRFWVFVFALLSLVLALSLGLEWLAAPQGFWRTAGLLTVVGVSGVLAVGRCARTLNDVRLLRLAPIFVIKLAIVMVLVVWVWSPELDPTSPWIGFDPTRYYQQAQILADNGFNPSALQINLNYTGIVFWYAGIFAVFGQNPFGPALVNTALSLFATLALVRTLYSLVPTRRSWDWMLGLLIVVPEMVMWDVVSARETIVWCMVVWIMEAFSPYLIAERHAALPRYPLTGLLCLLGLAVIRPPAIIPVVVAIVAAAFLPTGSGTWKASWWPRIAIIGVSVAALAIVPVLIKLTGSVDYDALSVLALPADQISALSWNEASIGRWLIPHSAAQQVAFGVVRSFAYIVAPLPAVPLVGVEGGYWSFMYSAAAYLSALVYTLMFPLALAAMIALLRRDEIWSTRYVQILFATLFLAVGGGNIVIQERYRIIEVPLLAACVWIGVRSRPRVIRASYLIWGSMSACGAALYAGLRLFR